MKQLHNGWYVPENEQKITSVLERDPNIEIPSYEQKYRDFIIREIPNKRTFIDVGANVGIWSRPLSKKFQKVVAYEPALHNLECLKLNVNQKVDIRDYAVADFVGEADFHQGQKNCGDSKLSRPGKKGNYSVSVKKLDDEQLKEVDLIKIDVQGWELEVLRGGIELIRQNQPWIIFEVNQDIDICCKFLEDLGYEMVNLKSKRVFLWGPQAGHNAVRSDLFGRWLGPGPYAEKLTVK